MRVLFQHSYNLVQGSASEFARMRDEIVRQLKTVTPVQRGTWQSEDVSGSSAHAAHELMNVCLVTSVPSAESTAQVCFAPDLPWAENHFQERVGGQPLNPPPSYGDWPYHSVAERDRFIRSGEGAPGFDHTYPERFWPKRANPDEVMQFRSGRYAEVNTGIRFAYGDLHDVLELLQKHPMTRQAYLPVWFPEDTGAVSNQRVPCTLGYHFIRQGPALNCNYFIRSCDVVRHFHNDVYLAARLTQWITDHLLESEELVWPGTLTMFISNLHLFKGDSWRVDRRG